MSAGSDLPSLGQIRTRLLGQHAGIRAEIDAVRAVCETLPMDRARLARILGQMIESVRTHNLAEEELLRGVLPRLDVFGVVRKDVMLSEHAAAHEDLRHTLVACTGADSTATVENILTLMERLQAHMEHEENLFLSARLLGQPGD